MFCVLPLKCIDVFSLPLLPNSPNSQIHIQIFHRIDKLFSIAFLTIDHGADGFHIVGCDRRYVEIGVPCRFCILFDFLVNWRTGSLQGVVHKLYHFGQQVLLCSTRSLPQDCRSLLNLLLLDATGLSAVFPSTRQGMHPAVALETSTLPQMSLVQYSSWCRISPKLSASRTSWCNRTRCGGRTCRNKRRYVYIAAGRDMDTTLSSSFWSCILFAIVEQLKKPKFSVQQVELKWLILNKWRSLFHSSRVKFPLLSTCLRVGVKLTDLNLGSKSILSNNQSRATLRFRETCLIVGFRPLIIILITASLFSKAYNMALEPEFGVFDGMWSMFVGMTLVCLIGMGLCMFGSTTADGFLHGLGSICSVRCGMKYFNTKSQRVRAGIPSVRKPASREMISASVELCETEVCFLHIQLNGTNVWLPKIHKTPPDVDFDSSRSPAKSESWNNSSLHCCAVFPT